MTLDLNLALHVGGTITTIAHVDSRTGGFTAHGERIELPGELDLSVEELRELGRNLRMMSNQLADAIDELKDALEAKGGEVR